MSIPNQMGSSLKNILNFAIKKGELGARVARLRLEIAGLARSREAAFARLGRGYHANPSATADLEPMLMEVDRIALEIRDRESVMAQLLHPTPKVPLILETAKTMGEPEASEGQTPPRAD